MNTFIDLFAGIGGWHYAVKQVWPNAQCLFASEINKDAARVYEQHHGINPLNDITKIDIAALPAADLVVASPPCQPFSKNGKWYNNNNRTVGDDDRADLLRYVIEYMRIHRPRFVFIENVAGLIKMKNANGGFYLDSILNAISNCGSGYMYRWSVLNTADYGLPQQRLRTYIVCLRNAIDAMNFHWPDLEPRTSCINNILEEDVDEKYYLHNRWAGRMCQVLEGSRLNQLTLDFERRLNGCFIDALDGNTPTGKITPIAMIYGDTPSKAPRQQDKLYSRFGISPTIATFELSIPNVDTDPWRVLTPRECARLQGFPETHQLPKDSLAYKQIGNAVSVPVVRKLLEGIRRL